MRDTQGNARVVFRNLALTSFGAGVYRARCSGGRMRSWDRFVVVSMMVSLGIVGCGGAQNAGPGADPANEKISAEPNGWVYGEWERCKKETGAAETYIRRGTNRDGCDTPDDTWIFSKDGKWTHGAESGAYSIGPTQSSCDLPAKSVGLAGTPGSVVMIWESDNRVTMTSPCLK